MDQKVIIAAIAGAVTISVEIFRQLGVFNRTRDNLQKDLQLYNALPTGSSTKKRLLNQIDSRIDRDVLNSNRRRRDPLGIFLALAFLVLGTYFTVLIVQRGGVWWFGIPLSIFSILLGLVGLGQDLPKRVRDEKGRVIKLQKK